MGAGKTAIVCRALPAEGRVVIVAPLRVAATVWPAELDLWTPEATYEVLAGKDQAQRSASTARIQIVNFELIPWAVRSGVFDGCQCVVLDELSRLKDRSGVYVKTLRKVLPKIPVRWGLTGTFVSQGIIDTWSQVWCIDLGRSLGRTFASFAARYLVQGFEHWDITPRAGAEEEIAEQIKPLVFSIEPADYADTLPPLRITPIYVTLPDDAREAYQALARDMVIDNIAAESRLVLTGKLQQFAQGAVYDEEREAVWFHFEKIGAAGNFLDHVPGPCLVVFQFMFELEYLRYFKPGPVLGEDDSLIDLWNEGELPILYLHPRSGGHGLNLQAGGRHILWLGPVWSLDLWRQTNARLHRSGATGPTHVSVIVAHNTVDYAVLAALEAKADVADAVDRYLRQNFCVGA